MWDELSRGIQLPERMKRDKQLSALDGNFRGNPIQTVGTR